MVNLGKRFSFAALFLIFAGINFLIFFKLYNYYGLGITGTDGQIYYSYVRSAVIDKDLDLFNELNYLTPHPENIPDSIKNQKTVTGLTPNRYPIGHSVLSAPFFITAHLITKFCNKTNLWILPEDGYSKIYDFLVPAGHFIYALLGFYIGFLFLKEYFLPMYAVIGMTTVWFSTSLVYYATRELMMAHAGGFFLVNLTLWSSLRISRSNSWYWLPLFTLSSSLMLLIRYSDIVFLIFPIWNLLVNRPKSYAATRPFGRTRIGPIVLSLLVLAALFGTQFAVWHVIYNDYFAFTHDKAIQFLPNSNLIQDFMFRLHQLGEYFSWSSPHIIDVLFSADNGLFYWHPIVFISLVGLCARALQSKDAPSVLLFSIFLLLLYINSAWKGWGFGSAFGARAFTEASVIFAFGLTYLLQFSSAVRFSYLRYFLIIICTVSIFWNMHLYVLYILGAIPSSGILNIRHALFIS